jgi:DNA-binding transcriptional regulator GbsR (MarR family)
MQQPGSEGGRFAQERMAEMHGVIERLTLWYDDIKRLDADRLATLLGLSSRVTKLLEAKDKILSIGPTKPGSGEA